MPGPREWTPWVPGLFELVLFPALLCWVLARVLRRAPQVLVGLFLWSISCMWVAAADHDCSHSPEAFSWSDTKMPPYLMLRGDTGTAQDILDRIEAHQANAPVAGADGLPQLPPDDAPPALDHELDALLAYPGDQQFAFYRAHPGGTTEFHLEVTLLTTLADVRQHLINTWPDLPLSTWQLVALDDSWYTSATSVPGAIAILVWVASDLIIPGASVIAMVENQKWNLADGTFETIYMPVSLPSSVTLPRLFEQLGIDQWCQQNPCTSRQNDRELLWRSQNILWDASLCRHSYCY